MLPTVNQALYIQINTIDEEESKKDYKARIADDLGDRLALEIPINEKTGRLKRLYEGDELSAFFLTEGGFKNFFTTTVIGFREDVIRQVLVRKPKPEDISKVQRRNFLRMPAELEIAVQSETGVRVIGVTEDVGGGGISFFCDKSADLSEAGKMSCWLLLPSRGGKSDHAVFSGIIVRIIPQETRKVVILQFAEIADKERQKIIRFCFEREQEIRKT